MPERHAVSPQAQQCDIACLMKATDIVFSAAYLYPGMNDLATLIAALVNISATL